MPVLGFVELFRRQYRPSPLAARLKRKASMRASANFKTRISSLGELFLEQQGDTELLFACILNHKVALNTRMLAAWCIYESALPNAWGTAPFAAVPDGVLQELCDFYSVCLKRSPQGWRRFYRWPRWERKSQAALAHAYRLAQEESARRHQQEHSPPTIQ